MSSALQGGFLTTRPPQISLLSFSMSQNPPKLVFTSFSREIEHKLLACRGPITEAKGISGGSDSGESACNVGDLGLIPESGRSPGEGNGSPLQYSSLVNPMDGGAWRATVHGS